MLKLRRELPALHFGSLECLEEGGINTDLLVYQRKYEEQVVLVIINFADRPNKFTNPLPYNHCLFAVGMEAPSEFDEIILQPFSGLLLSM